MGRSAISFPAAATSRTPKHRAHVAGVWGIDPEELPRGGVDAYEIFRQVDRGEVRGLLSICFNPIVSLPDQRLCRWMLATPGVLRHHRLLHERDGTICRHRAARALCTRKTKAPSPVPRAA